MTQEVAQARAEGQAFLETDEKGFKVGGEGMAVRAAKSGLVSLPALNDAPIKKRKELAIVGDQGIGIQQGLHGRLVKACRRGYHSQNLLLVDMMDCVDTLQKEVCFCQWLSTKVL